MSLPWHPTEYRPGDRCPRREISAIVILLKTSASDKHPVAVIALRVGLIRAWVRSINLSYLDLFHGLFVSNRGAEESTATVSFK